MNPPFKECLCQFALFMEIGEYLTIAVGQIVDPLEQLIGPFVGSHCILLQLIDVDFRLGLSVHVVKKSQGRVVHLVGLFQGLLGDLDHGAQRLVNMIHFQIDLGAQHLGNILLQVNGTLGQLMGLLHRILCVLGILQIELRLRFQFDGQGTSLPGDFGYLLRLLAKFHGLLLGLSQGLFTLVAEKIQGLLQLLLGVLRDLVQDGVIVSCLFDLGVSFFLVLGGAGQVLLDSI